VARECKIFTWGQIIEIGERYQILPKGLKASQAKTFICDHPDNCAILRDVIKTDQTNKKKLDEMFETLKAAWLVGWKDIAYFACLADLIEPGTAIEEVQKILIEDPEAVEKIINSAKIEEKAEQEIADEDIPD